MQHGVRFDGLLNCFSNVQVFCCSKASPFAVMACQTLKLAHLHADRLLTASNLLMTTAANDGQHAMTCQAWHEQPGLQERLEFYIARAEAAMGFARTAARLQAHSTQQSQASHNLSDEDATLQQPASQEQLNANLAFIEENTGDLQLETVQNAPPIYNQMLIKPDRTSAAYQQACRKGIAAFSTAAQFLPDEWEFHLYIAKLLRKSAASDQKVLSHLAKACCLAKLHNKGLIEPLYQLHSMRLKLALRVSPDLDVVGRYSFAKAAQPEPELPQGQSSLQQFNSAAAEVNEISLQPATNSMLEQAPRHGPSAQQGVPAAATDRHGAIVSDAMAAMTWCLEQSKSGNYETFHKARYRQAQALHTQGQYGEALQILQPLFRKKGLHSFSINLYMIDMKAGNKVRKAHLISSIAQTLLDICITCSMVCLESNVKHAVVGTQRKTLLLNSGSARPGIATLISAMYGDSQTEYLYAEHTCSCLQAVLHADLQDFG